jgi:hypothetical protein
VQLRLKPWQFAAVLVLACAVLTGLVVWRHNSQRYDASRLMQTLPVGGAVKVFLNFEALRDAALMDLITGPKTVEDPDYRRFAEEIGFDYRTDLAAVAAVFVQGDFYAAARGHFNWKRLGDYTRAQQGSCDNGICSLPGGQPGRFVSFYELSPDVLALAVSGRPDGANLIGPPSGKVGITVPPAAFWISIPGTDFKGLKNLPAGTTSFVAPLAQARETAFSVQPAPPAGPGSPSRSNATFQIRMDVSCESPDAAAALARVFTSITDVLRTLIVKEGVAPKPSDLTAVLVSGRFETHESSVTGFWPMDRRVIESLVSGQTK